MNDHEMSALLLQAHTEIVNLRRANELLRARVDTMDLFATVLFTQPYQVSQGMAEDVAWKLRKAMTALEPKNTIADEASPK